MSQIIYSADVKEDAKKALAGNYGIVIVVGLVFMLITNFTSIIDMGLQFKYAMEHDGIISFFMPVEQSDVEQSDKESDIKDDGIKQANDGGVSLIFNNVSENGMFSTRVKGYKTPTWLVILDNIISFITIPLSVGFALFTISILRTKTGEMSMLFSQYSKYIKILLVDMYRFILVFLQLLLFIIPGIVAAFSYSMTDYILADNDEIGVTEAVTLSKEMMKGHKWQYFCVNMSFLGWFILSGMTAGLLYVAYVGPYYNITMAAFYERVKNEYEGQFKSETESFGDISGDIY